MNAATRALVLGERARPTVLLVGTMALAGFVDGVCDHWVHGAVLGGAAVAVWWDASRPPTVQPALPRNPLPLRSVAALAGVALTYVVATGALQRYSWPLTLAVVGPGVSALLLAWRPAPSPPGPPPLAVWAVVFVSGGLWELGALLAQPSPEVGSYAPRRSAT